MPDTFCYLLGAGASCNALPVSANLPDKMEQFVIDYRTFREDLSKQKSSDSSLPTDTLQFEDHFIDSMKWLIEETRRHTSVDTIAKKLFLKTDMRNLNRLKATLSTFMILHQAMKPTDYRYDALLATILQSNVLRQIEMPSNIVFVTWNYDLQMEKAYYAYTQDIKGIYQQVSRKIERINGQAGSTPSGHFTKYIQAGICGFSIDTVLIALELYSLYATDANRYIDDICFAWESDNTIFERNITPIIDKTSILIDIGYSFPYFNRDIDRIILRNMPNLRRIYLQVLKPEHEFIKTRISALTNDKVRDIQLVNDEKKFFIPYEL